LASSRDSLGKVCERSAQLGQPEAHAPLHGPGRQVEHPGDLAVREPAELRQLDHLALLGGEVDERAPSRGSNHPLLISGPAFASTLLLLRGTSNGPEGVTGLWISRPIAAA